MNKSQQVSLLLLRLSLGSLFFYAGITKIMDPNWSAAGYLKGAKIFVPLYAWFANPVILPTINFLNEWGLTLIGLALILGVFLRLAVYAGVLLMLLYYFALSTMKFPFPNANALIVDEHIIYALGLILLANFNAGGLWGLKDWFYDLALFSKFPKLRRWL